MMWPVQYCTENDKIAKAKRDKRISFMEIFEYFIYHDHNRNSNSSSSLACHIYSNGN